jgi:hypothetical protein
MMASRLAGNSEQRPNLPWKGQVTDRRPVGEWPQSICAENPDFEGSEAAPQPAAATPDF